jgi:hypothetical protein
MRPDVAFITGDFPMGDGDTATSWHGDLAPM